MSRSILVATLIIGSCTTGVKLKHVDLGTGFHDGSSKVFVVDKFYIHHLNTTPKNLYDKELMIFYASGVVNYLPLKAIGRAVPHRGTYELDSQNRILRIEFDEQVEWNFSIEIMSADSIFMKRINTTSDSVSILLKPLPPL